MAQEKQSTSHRHTGIVLLIWDGHSLLQQEVTNISCEYKRENIMMQMVSERLETDT